MENNFFVKLLLKLKIINPEKKIAAQLRRPHGQLAQYVGEQMNAGNRGLYEFMLGEVNISNGDDVLEIGYGNGHFYEEIFEKAPEAKISGLDFSEAMYNAATATNTHFIEAGKLNLHHGSSNQMPFNDNSFDKVFCLNVIYFWEKPEEHLKEVLRVLKPGSKFYAGVRTKESLLQIPFTKYGFNVYHPEEWETIFKQNHFNNTSVKHTVEKEVLFNEQKVEISSACIVGEK